MSRVALYQPRHELVSAGLHLVLYAMLEEELARHRRRHRACPGDTGRLRLPAGRGPCPKARRSRGWWSTPHPLRRWRSTRKLPVPFTCLTTAQIANGVQFITPELAARVVEAATPPGHQAPGGDLVVPSGTWRPTTAGQEEARKFARLLWRSAAAAGVDLVAVPPPAHPGRLLSQA